MQDRTVFFFPTGIVVNLVPAEVRGGSLHVFFIAGGSVKFWSEHLLRQRTPACELRKRAFFFRSRFPVFRLKLFQKPDRRDIGSDPAGGTTGNKCIVWNNSMIPAVSRGDFWFCLQHSFISCLASPGMFSNRRSCCKAFTVISLSRWLYAIHCMMNLRL